MSKTKVLYVEDELFLGKIVKESLESRGFDVVMESDGAKATAAFKESDPDICVLDVMLPNKDGFAIADEIRNISEEVPIIFLTAKTQTEDVVKGFSLGGNDYIRKPFSMEELIVRIQNALRNKTEAPNRKKEIAVPHNIRHVMALKVGIKAARTPAIDVDIKKTNPAFVSATFIQLIFLDKIVSRNPKIFSLFSIANKTCVSGNSISR